ncbi:MAG TPA: hypothetical protein VJN93_15510 [Candidatus Acidoferrum sp.]|nr:hypothetical protein [Candidatus Acidoferrum sp.]
MNLKAGETIEVRSAEEILATLDQRGMLDNMPFMPEMLQYCGKRFRVFKRAHKTCDNIQDWSMRTVQDAVHLSGVRCDGRCHADCDAGCMIFWREAWLKRAPDDLVSVSAVQQASAPSEGTAKPLATGGCSLEALRKAACLQEGPSPEESVYMCQATEVRLFSTHLSDWDIRQYFRDIFSGNLSRGIAESKSESLLEMLLGFLEVIRSLLILFFNKLQSARKGVLYPHIEGSLVTTPGQELALKPGEFVRVKSKQEILSTLDRRNRNRGLLFDSEMVKYCGGTYRVHKRVYQIVDERTGKVMKMKSPCIILEGVACASDYHRLCPRAIYHYWRENWLCRVD